ncbi:MAG: hypothetical protein GXP36_14275 [Actinobacteria bacterium]|nr:hypothetical protein [Actinomycetota bacterium]
MTAEQHGSERLSQSEAERLREILQSQENTTAGFVAGALAAVIGAVAWAILVVVTELQIGIVAIGIGALVGFAVARFGKGIDKSFGIMAGVLALLGVAFGNVLGVAAFAADGIAEIPNVLFDRLGPGGWVEVLTALQPLDFLFYGFAAYYAFQSAQRRVGMVEARQLLADGSSGGSPLMR